MSVPTQPSEGFHYDELSKIRVIDPTVAAETTELKEECKEFVDSEFLNNAHHRGMTSFFFFALMTNRDRGISRSGGKLY